MTTDSSPKDCSLFPDCSSNLCPLDFNMKNKVWLPQENDHSEICHSPEFTGLQFIRTQKKIAKASRKKNAEREDYFSFLMLDRNITVGSAIRGIQCDLPDSTRDTMKCYSDKEKKWVLRHPEKNQLSVGERQKRADRMRMIRKTPFFIHSQEMANSKGATASLYLDTSPIPGNNGGSGQ